MSLPDDIVDDLVAAAQAVVDLPPSHRVSEWGGDVPITTGIDCTSMTEARVRLQSILERVVLAQHLEAAQTDEPLPDANTVGRDDDS